MREPRRASEVAPWLEYDPQTRARDERERESLVRLHGLVGWSDWVHGLGLLLAGWLAGPGLQALSTGSR